MTPLSIDRVWEGAGCKLTVTFEDPDTGEPTAVTEPVVITIKKPDATTITPTVTNVGIGTYEASFIASQPGTWHVRAISSGTQPGVDEDSFEVHESMVI